MSTITRKTAESLTRPTVEGLHAALAAGPARGLDAALAAALARGVELWAVGGAVRDLALGRALFDLDLATSDDPGPEASAAASALNGTVESFPRFGTASAMGAAGRLDFARLRAETYEKPGALPSPQFGASIEADLGRRDFTVNAIALCLSGPRRGEIVDPYGGLADLEARRLRSLHEGAFRDDATRIWRGARYAARLGLRPDAETRARLIEGVGWLEAISGERLWAEFERTAAEPWPGRVLALLEEWGAIQASAAGLRLHPDATRALARRRGPLEAGVLLATLLGRLEARDMICERLAAPREMARAAREAAALVQLVEPGPDELAAVEGGSETARTAARWLYPAQQRDVQLRLRRWERTRPHLTSAELEALGVPKGPALGEWLRRLRAARYLGTLRGAAAARKEVRKALETAAPETTKEPR